MRKKKKITKKLAMLMLMGVLMTGTATKTFAYANEEADVKTESTTEYSSEETSESSEGSTENTQSSEGGRQGASQVLDEQLSDDSTEKKESSKKTERSSGEKIDRSDAFTTIGNAEVMDDITDDSTKEFLTIVTKNNQTFYIVIDRSSTTDNVYMLSNIDENDLQEFLDETSKGTESTTEAPAIVLPEITRDVEEATETDDKEEKEEKGALPFGGMTGMGLALASVLGGLGAAFYFRIYKPQNSAEEDSGNEGLEDGNYVEIDEDAQ